MKKTLLIIASLLFLCGVSYGLPPGPPLGLSPTFTTVTATTFVGAVTGTASGNIPNSTIVAAGDVLVGSAHETATVITKGATNSFFGVNYLDVLGFFTTIRLSDEAAQFAHSDASTALGGFDLSGVTAGTTALIKPVVTANATLSTPSLAANDEFVMRSQFAGLAPVTITTTSAGTTIGGTYKSGWIFTNPTSASATSILTLPTAVAGLNYCVGNGPAKTGVLTIYTALSPTGTQKIDLDGALTANTGGIQATATSGNYTCVIGINGTQWKAMPMKGTWTKITR
jgi:hypothetical protein